MSKVIEFYISHPLFTGLVAGVTVFLFSVLDVYSKNKRAKRLSEKIHEAESKVNAEPQKAKPAWDLARVTLEAYFNRNLSQIAAIFRLSLFVMFGGFGVIIWGVFQAFHTPSNLLPATVGAVSGIITEFIGATFLFIYRSTIQQAASYSQTLERINSVGMAMQILDTMPEETKPNDLKSMTKASLVELLVRQTHDTQKNEQDSSRMAKKNS